LRVEVEELKKANAELEDKVNDLENQIKTLEYVNGEYAVQEWQLIEKIESLENQLKNLEPIVVISPRSMSPAKAILPVISVIHTELSDSENENSAEDSENTEDSESVKDQLSP